MTNVFETIAHCSSAELSLLRNDAQHLDAELREYARARLRNRGLVDERGLYTPLGKVVRQRVLAEYGR